MKIELAKTEIIHFIGIGGIGMSGLALIMKGMGFKIQGSDISYSKNIERLKKNKIKVITFNSLTTSLCKKYKSNIILRGLRAVSDFEYEFQLAGMNRKLNKNIEILFNFTTWIKEKMKSSKDDVSAACNDYLKVLGLVATAHAWVKVLEVSFKDYENNKKFYEEKIQTANFFFNRVLPRIESYYLTATSGSKYIMDFKFN